jgi:2-polyprenyl-3-methyl-5-hydroxy-6-metoxy-1,4-benzoquinol methylase
VSLYVTAYSCDGGGSLPASRAPVWLRWLVKLDNPFTEANHSELIIRNLDLQPGDDHLDIGCGPGRLTIPVAQQVGPQGAVVAI